MHHQVDTAFTNRVNKHVYSTVPATALRIRGIVNELSLRKVHIVRAQVKVGMADRGIHIRTELDGLGSTIDGRPVVIEIKATNATLAQHRAGYERACTRRGRMLSGHANSLAMRHQVQLGFGALCIGATHGVVVVSCSDGTTSYALRPEFINRRVFTFAVKGRAAGAPKEVVMPCWPANDGPILASLPAKMQGWTVSRDARPASARFVGPGKHDTAVASIIIGRATKKKVKAAAVAAKSIPATTHLVLVLGQKGWRSTCVG